MQIKVKGIPKDGLEFSKSIEPSEIGLTEEDLTCLGPLEIKVKAECIQNTVNVQADVHFKHSFSCARCLEDVERDVNEDYKFDYLVEKNTESIDIGEDIRQEIILGLPAKILCRDDCKGICLHCGANLNEEECKCSK